MELSKPRYGPNRFQRHQHEEKPDHWIQFKKLETLYELSKAANQANASLDSILETVVETIPHSFQNPNNCCVTISLDGDAFSEDRFFRTANRRTELPGYSIIRDIVVWKRSMGVIQVFWSDEERELAAARFLGEDNKLVNEVALLLAGILERNTKLDALKDNELRFRSLVELTSDWTYSCSTDFIIKTMNPSLIKEIGHDASGEICYKTIHKFHSACPWCACHDTETGDHVERELQSPRNNHDYQMTQTTVSQSGKQPYRIVALKDITNQKERKQNLLLAKKKRASMRRIKWICWMDQVTSRSGPNT